MTKTEFQAEAAMPREIPRHSDSAAAAPHTPVTLDSLMLGLQLRRWLTDDERQFLDSLAPAPLLAFLVQDGRYLHPYDVPLFDPEQLDSMLGQTADAIFTQRYEHATNGHTAIYHIHWANLTPTRDQSLIFGLFGPTHQMSSPNAINRFYRLIAELRRAYADGARVVDQISTSLADDCAGMVVDRDTGTILCCNDHMADLCKCSSQQLVGRSIQEVRLESDATGRNPIKMEHVDQSHYHLCLIRTGRTLAVEDDNDPVMAAQFMHAMRNKLTGILGSAAELALELPPEHTPMLESLLLEGKQLSEQVNRFDLLLTYRNRTNQAVEARHEVALAISQQSEKIRFHEETHDSRSAIVRAPSGAWRTLVAAVLDQHRSGRAPSDFDIEMSGDADNILITVQSTADRRTGTKPFFGQYVNRLAKLLGVDVSTVADDDSGRMTTEIRSPRIN